ncbi:hypothetical protein QJQ45_024366 [Haematococcus lacustris]|nr:hypothetical protein QJQ45_024366 [Haematococcus lacustris]
MSKLQAGPLPRSSIDKQQNRSHSMESHTLQANESKGLLIMEAASTLAFSSSAQPQEPNSKEGNGAGSERAATEQLNVHENLQKQPAADVVNAIEPSAATPNFFVRLFRRAQSSLQVYARNVRRKPALLLLPPLLVFAVCVALGVYGVVAGAQKEAADKRSVVYGAGLDWAASFQLSFEQSFTPLVTLSIFIKQNPYFPSFALNFQTIADDVVATLPNNTIQEIQVSPLGVIAAVWPLTSQLAVSRIGLDTFNASALRGGALATVSSKKLLLNGPLDLLPSAYGAIVRLPVFVQNSSLSETFGTNRSMPTNCVPQSICYDPATREKFWGFVTIILLLEELRNGTDPRLDLLKQKGYLWSMTRPWTTTEVKPVGAGPEYVFCASKPPPRNPVQVPLEVSNNNWTVYLEPAEGWTPAWEAGMIVLVVLGSGVLAILIAIIMASWAQQGALLQDVLTSNKALAATTAHLEEEKLRLDALLVRWAGATGQSGLVVVRQYNLISVLGGPAGRAPGKTSEGSVTSKEGITLERIEGMRRQLAVNSNSSAADIDSIQTNELLGEGTFGKVYKGLWRGTVVAVKTMVMPANMSGAEKREKMAIMEAAISSSLSHPNIVQTYTYAIRPIKDRTAMPEGMEPGLLVTSDGTTTAGADAVKDSGSSMSNISQNVHSYEVRLVLEYCDKGSLREALDEGAFMGANGLNYHAVLDTGLDVAKAMLHLHSLNVLHADLKARNVMLKSGGEGRTVVAKVADFGLSLKMDHLETHISSVFQGTMTHMAPEIMLEGRVSKAADVYAFGITLWELFTGGHAFKGVPRALLGHQITREALRPRWPDAAPPGLRTLAERCWHHVADSRPTFETVLETLMSLRAAEPGETPPLNVIGPKVLAPASQAAAAKGAGAGAVALPKRPQGKGDAASFYMDASLGSAAVVGDSSKDWAPGSALATAKGTTRQRPLALPQIAEAMGEGAPSTNELKHQKLLEGPRTPSSTTAAADAPGLHPQPPSAFSPGLQAPLSQPAPNYTSSIMLGGSIMQVADASEVMSHTRF